jgi:hypothetical protein
LVKHGANGEMLDEAFVNYCNDTLPLNEAMQMEMIMSQHILLEGIK